jgi:hypothetical protein
MQKLASLTHRLPADESGLFLRILLRSQSCASEIWMIQDSDGNIGSILNSEGTHLIWNKVAHQQTCPGGKWHGEGTYGKAIERTWAGMAK